MYIIDKKGNIIDKPLIRPWNALQMGLNRETLLTFHKSLTETMVEDSSPSAAQLTVIVAIFEHRFHRATTRRLPDNGPAQTLIQN